MENTYLDKSYTYAVARLRHEELKLLDRAFLDELLAAPSVDAAIGLLKDRDWGGGASDPEEMYELETERLWDYVDEIVPDLGVFDVFRVENDYNNLKAAIKESMLEFEYPGVYLGYGSVPYETIRDAIRQRAYKDLPVRMAEVAEAAHEEFLKTGDGQLLDIMVDRACLEHILAAAEASQDDFIEEYARLRVGAADIKIAQRAILTGKDRDFLNTAIADCPGMSIAGLISATLSGEESLAQFLSSTDFASGAGELKESPSAFERYSDDLINEKMINMHYEAFGAGPIAAYIIARQNEIKSVRIILSGLQNGFPSDVIKERVRDTYV